MRLDIVQQFSTEANLVFSGGKVWLCHSSGHRVCLGGFWEAMGKIRTALNLDRFRFMFLFTMVSHFNRSQSPTVVQAVRSLVMEHMHRVEA